MSDPKSFVHILKSITHPFESYTAVTSNPQARLISHNAGLSSHTAEHRPWRTLVVIQFDEEEPGAAFERYLKTGSGRGVRETSHPVNVSTSSLVVGVKSGLPFRERLVLSAGMLACPSCSLHLHERLALLHSSDRNVCRTVVQTNCGARLSPRDA